MLCILSSITVLVYKDDLQFDTIHKAPSTILRVYSESFHLGLEVLTCKITSLESWLRLL
jgi:hypothetical protein